MATKSKLDLVKEAQAEQQEVINTKRDELLQSYLDQEAIGGKDDLKASILAMLEKRPEGIPWPFLQSLFPDALLAAARKALKDEKKIEIGGKKGRSILKLAVK